MEPEADADEGMPVPQTPSQKIRRILDKPVPKVVLHESEEGQHKYSLFCQMDVLMHYEDGDFGWKEEARFVEWTWLKDVFIKMFKFGSLP